MEEVLRYLRDYETWIYLVLIALAAWQIRKFILAWEELRSAMFGMEREKAQNRLNSAAVWIVFFILVAIAEFTLVSFVAPSVPGALALSTPTLNLLVTPTTTLPASTPGVGTPQAATTPSPPASASLENNGCIPEQIMISFPKDGAEIRDVVTITGTVDILDFGFYKYEVARPGDTAWLPIQAGRAIVRAGPLGDWDTRTVPPGEYLLRLIVTDNKGQALTPCSIRVLVLEPTSP
jgi:hypothetical protein